MSITMFEPSGWWADEDAFPEWFEEAFTEGQRGLPNVVKWQLCMRMLDLTPTQSHVALVLSTYMHVTTLKAHPSVASLACNTGRRKDTVRTALVVLENRGWLEITRYRNTKGTARSANHYAGRFADDVKVIRGGGDGKPAELWQYGLGL